MTLHQLLTHTGGLPEYCGEDFDRMPLATMLSGCLSRPPAFAPGTGHGYSNPGFSIGSGRSKRTKCGVEVAGVRAGCERAVAVAHAWKGETGRAIDRGDAPPLRAA